jgi:hypothetical protein
MVIWKPLKKDPSTDIFSHQLVLDHQGHFSNKMEFEVAAFSVNLIAAKLVKQQFLDRMIKNLGL